MHTGLIKVAALHHLALAISFGGPIFAKVALRKAARKELPPAERVKLMTDTWTRFNKLNVPAHLVFTGTWLIERRAINRYFGDRHTEKLVHAKDLLVAGALVTGVAAVIAGEMLKRQIPEGRTATESHKVMSLAKYRRFFKIVGPLNLLFVGSSIAITPRIGASIIRHSRLGLLGRLFGR